jgi:PAS domain S-box-containing protein
MSETNPLQTILDNLHAAVLVINQDLGIECMNPSAEHLFQISSKRAMTRSIVKLVPGEPEFHDRLARSLISGHPFTVYDTGLQNHDGTVMNVDYSASPIAYRPAGKFLLLEFTRLNSFMKISKEETLIHQHDATRSLLRNLAHEIKNPLGGIRGSAQLLDRELDGSDRELPASSFGKQTGCKIWLTVCSDPRAFQSKRSSISIKCSSIFVNWSGLKRNQSPLPQITTRACPICTPTRP